MNSSIGYIYIRTNEYWDLYDAFKLGKTLSIPDREQTYITSEIKRGFYVMILEIELLILDNVEKQLHLYFNKLNLRIKFNAGIEFYKKEIINFIIPYFDKNNIKCKILSKDEIDTLIRKIRIYDNIINNEKQIENIDLNNKIYNPRDYQEIIINKSYEYFQTNEKGLLIVPCGVGKTLISLWISKQLKSNTILIGVPNKLLLKQWEETICILFQSIPYLIVSGGINIEKIMQFLENNQKKCIIITTYASAHKLYSAIENTNFIFDMKLNDEVHHLTSTNMSLLNTTRKYIQMLIIPSIKQLSLTATLKQLENMCDDIHVVSNDNVEHFGQIIVRKCLLWAINENIICDYVIQTIITDEEQLEEQLTKFHIIEETDKRLFLTAFACLKSIFERHSHHLLIYSNNTDNSLKLTQYIKILLDDNYFEISDLYYSNYHSQMKLKEQKKNN
jgi:superfamily II DNA or RNA helicase